MGRQGVKATDISYSALSKEWQELLLLKNPGWSWLGDQYSRPGRTQAHGFVQRPL